MTEDSATLTALVVAASGYVIYASPICRFLLTKEQGYTLYFLTLTIGVILLCLVYPLHRKYFDFLSLPILVGSVAILIWLLSFSIYRVCRLCKKTLESKEERKELNIFGNRILFKIHKFEHKIQLRKIEHSLLSQSIYEAVKTGSFLQITLENNKVYIGWPYEFNPKSNEKWLPLIPCYSGYRDEEGKMHITIDYLETYIKIFDEGKKDKAKNETILPNYKMTVPVEKVLSWQILGPAIFLKLNEWQLKNLETWQI